MCRCVSGRVCGGVHVCVGVSMCQCTQVAIVGCGVSVKVHRIL